MNIDTKYTKNGDSDIDAALLEHHSKKSDSGADDLKIADGKILIKTKLGTLVISPNDDAEYPGVFIDLRRPGFDVDAPLAAIECYAGDDEPRLTTAVWPNVNDEDNSTLISHEGVEEFFTYFNPGGIVEVHPAEGL